MNKTRFILCLSLVLMIALTLGLSIFSNSTAVCENYISEEECILETRIIDAKKNLRYNNQFLENDSQEIQVKFLDKYKNELDKLNFTNIEIARMMTLAMGYPEEIVDDLEDEILLDNLNVKESSLYVSNRSLSPESPTMYSGYKTYGSESGSMTNPTYKITTYFKWEQTPSNLYSDYISMHYPYEFLCTNRFNHYSIDTERYWLKWKHSYFHADSNGIVRSDYEEKIFDNVFSFVNSNSFNNSLL